MAISDAQFAAWLLKDNADANVLSARCVIAELDYQYELAGVPATGTLYFSDKVYFDGSGTHPYVECIAVIPEFSRSLSGNQFGTYTSSVGSLELENADGSLDYLLTLAIDGNAIRFKLGDVSWPIADFRFIFSCLALKAVAPSFDRISIPLTDTGILLSKSIGGATKVGGSGPNADKFRKVNFGLVHQVECDVLDPATLTYVHSDTGVGLVTSAADAKGVRDRGFPVAYLENGDGTFRLVQSPAGTITALLLYSATTGIEHWCTSDHMRHFVGERSGLIDLGLYYGPGPTYSTRPATAVAAWIDAGGEDYKLGTSLEAKRNVIDLLGDICDSGLCFWAIRRDSKFTFGRLRPNYIAGLGITPTKIITDDLIDADGSFQIDHLPPAYYQFQATMSKNWSIQTDLASGLSANDRAALLRTGLYVLQNGGVGTSYANAPELYNKTMVQSPTIETLLSGANDATDPAVLQLWMETRRAMSLPWITLASVKTGIECYDVELGDPVTVKLASPSRYGYDAGVDFQCTGITIKLPSKVELKLIRRDVQASYGSRPTTPPDGAPFSGAAKNFVAVASFIAGVATGTPTGTAPAAPLASLTATASFISGSASSSTQGGPGGGTFVQAPYVTIGNDSRLTDERALTAGTGITVTDNGPNSTVVIAATGGGSSSPLTTKGDVWGFDTDDDRIPVGANNYVLTADSTQALGVKWAAVPASGTLQGQEFTTPGSNTYNVPSGITSVWATFIGAGGAGGGSTADGTGGGGGGSGEQVVSMPMIVTSGGTLAIVIGAAGAGASGAAGGAGGTTTVGGFNALGGLGGLLNSFGGAGGGPLGGAGGTASNPGITGRPEAVTYFAGSGGGGPGLTGVAGAAGGPSGGTSGGAGGALVSSKSGGGGGASSPYGVGGAGGGGGSNGTNATAGRYGTGGGGAGGKTAVSTGGNGMDGYCLIQWIA